MSRKEKKELRKKQALAVGAGVVLAVLSLLTQTHFLIRGEDGDRIMRPSYGETEQTFDVNVKGSGGKEEITLTVRDRIYTEEEARALFEELMPGLMEVIRGENEGLMKVKTDLCFPESMEGYPGVSLSWENNSGGLIESDGKVNNADLTEAREEEIRLAVKAGTEVIETRIPVRVLPAPERLAETPRKERLEKYLKERDLETRTEETYLLPSEFEGEALSFSEPTDLTWLLFPALGLVAAVLLELMPKEEEKKKKKRREDELLADYSEIVSKLIVYIGAGLTVRNAWHQLAAVYAETKGPKRAVYEEIAITERELANGETESKAYMAFARRCDLKCYIRMVSLLEQNRKTGDSALLAALELEMEEAFEQRKNVAKRLGEEAGTKLMAPLVLSLLTVLVIVVIPAVMTMS